VGTLTAERIAELVHPYVAAGGNVDWRQAGERVCVQLADYLELILRWNERMNLTAVREPEDMVRRHFGESLFVGMRLEGCETLLDYGSGAGFPGVPIQLLRPEVTVTLAESQGKKAAFLREAVRTLGLEAEVWPARVEAMAPGRRFDEVAMRAVDGMEAAVKEAGRRAKGRVLVLGTTRARPDFGEGFVAGDGVAVPGSEEGVLWVGRRG